jgi:hypothetical protein
VTPGIEEGPLTELRAGDVEVQDGPVGLKVAHFWAEGDPRTASFILMEVSFHSKEGALYKVQAVRRKPDGTWERVEEDGRTAPAGSTEESAAWKGLEDLFGRVIERYR